MKNTGLFKDTKQQMIFVNNLDKQSTKMFAKYLKGNITISHCHWHDTIILIFDFDYFQHTRRRSFSKNCFYR